jgi:hypothetical protein
MPRCAFTPPGFGRDAVESVCAPECRTVTSTCQRRPDPVGASFGQNPTPAQRIAGTLGSYSLDTWHCEDGAMRL